MAATHRADIVPDAKRGYHLAKLGLHTRTLHDPRRTGRAKHRAPAHLADMDDRHALLEASEAIASTLDRMVIFNGLSPLAKAQDRTGGDWDDHFARTYLNKETP